MYTLTPVHCTLILKKTNIPWKLHLEQSMPKASQVDKSRMTATSEFSAQLLARSINSQVFTEFLDDFLLGLI